MPALPLDGIRIFDLTRILAGPTSTQLLGDLGADVIKIERAGAGDDTRKWGPPYVTDAAGKATNESAYYLSANRNKRSISLDLSKKEGQELALRLIAKSDVLAENFKVGDLAKFGLDYATLAKKFPKLVYCSITGFGQTGPYAPRAGYDMLAQGLGGIMSVTGPAQGSPESRPYKVGVGIADIMTGMYAAVSILAALRHRDATGEGQHIDMALLDTQVAMLANLGANYLVSGKVPGRAGNAHQNIVPYQVFEVAPAADGSRDHLILAVGNDSQYAKFCEVAGRPELASDPRFASNRQRVLNRGELVPLLETLMKTRRKADWLSALERAKVPCGAINNLAEVFADPQVRSRDMVSQWQHPNRSLLPLVSSPMKLGATPVRDPQRGGLPPPLLGQHTEEVLRSVLQYSDAQVDALKNQQVI
jgi:crotonobetainyl-CoA:carnitine CoA-transferase CaiB-like acyl-CoA transferase